MSEEHPEQSTLEGAAMREANAEKDRARGEERPHLRAVETGEVPADGSQSLAEALTKIEHLTAELSMKTLEAEGLDETVRSQGAKIRLLRRDKEAKARRDALWPDAVELFTYWKVCTGHSRTDFTVERFELLRPFLKKDGLAVCRLAVDGAVYDPYHADKPNRNGHIEVHDHLETIFKSRAGFERHVNRAPRERLHEVKEGGGFGKIDPLELRIKAEVILTLMPEDDKRPYHEKTDEAVERARRELNGERARRGQGVESKTA